VSAIRPWLQLLRLPNVFTAIADVLMGYLFTHAIATPTLRLPPEFWCLVGASCLLYSAGMVLNDVYDYEIDARDRPHRPLPSGRVLLNQARLFGFLLLLSGVGLGALASLISGQIRPAIVALLLAIAVVVYDRVVKQTPLAPLVMGSCRFLNVLLGMSVMPTPWQPIHWLVAAGIAIYIAGVTWFARTEARQSNRLALAAGTAVMLIGIGLLAWYPWWSDALVAEASQPDYVIPNRWLTLWTIVGLMIAWRCVVAVFDPSPAKVQYAVKNCIFSLIMLDGIVTFGVRGMFWAFAVLLLLVPTMFLGRWIYST
jgi:4-hydroxybenzoate polyprenyltransferase